MSKLKLLRERQNLTQEALSEQSHISVRTIQRIEAGTVPKGHTLKVLSDILKVPQSDLLDVTEIIEPQIPVQKSTEIPAESISMNQSKIKWINLSSLLFIVLPPLNILAPLLLRHVLKQQNNLTKQIISVQMLWTILAPIVFLSGIFLKLGRRFTLLLIIAIVLSNVLIILRNAFEIDRNKQLFIKLNFSMI